MAAARSEAPFVIVCSCGKGDEAKLAKGIEYSLRDLGVETLSSNLDGVYFESHLSVLEEALSKLSAVLLVVGPVLLKSAPSNEHSLKLANLGERVLPLLFNVSVDDFQKCLPLLASLKANKVSENDENPPNTYARLVHQTLKVKSDGQVWEWDSCHITLQYEKTCHVKHLQTLSEVGKYEENHVVLLGSIDKQNRTSAGDLLVRVKGEDVAEIGIKSVQSLFEKEGSFDVTVRKATKTPDYLQDALTDIKTRQPAAVRRTKRVPTVFIFSSLKVESDWHFVAQLAQRIIDLGFTVHYEFRNFEQMLTEANKALGADYFIVVFSQESLDRPGDTFAKECLGAIFSQHIDSGRSNLLPLLRGGLTAAVMSKRHRLIGSYNPKVVKTESHKDFLNLAWKFRELMLLRGESVPQSSETKVTHALDFDAVPLQVTSDLHSQPVELSILQQTGKCCTLPSKSQIEDGILEIDQNRQLKRAPNYFSGDLQGVSGSIAVSNESSFSLKNSPTDKKWSAVTGEMSVSAKKSEGVFGFKIEKKQGSFCIKPTRDFCPFEGGDLLIGVLKEGRRIIFSGMERSQVTEIIGSLQEDQYVFYIQRQRVEDDLIVESPRGKPALFSKEKDKHEKSGSCIIATKEGEEGYATAAMGDVFGISKAGAGAVIELLDTVAELKKDVDDLKKNQNERENECRKNIDEKKPTNCSQSFSTL